MPNGRLSPVGAETADFLLRARSRLSEPFVLAQVLLPGTYKEALDEAVGLGEIALEGPSPRQRWLWLERCHVCVDDATRLAYVVVLPDERGETAAGFLRRAVAWFAERASGRAGDDPTTVPPTARWPTPRPAGNSASAICARAPYRPPTNGRAEHLIQTMPREWAYGRPYGSSAERSSQLAGWLDRYNYRRKHGSPRHRPLQLASTSCRGTTSLGTTART